MFTRLFRPLILTALTLSLCAPAAPSRAAAPASDELTAPRQFLRRDGTLALDGHFSGALNLAGYTVRMDAQHGPVFSSATPAGEWSAAGDGGGAIDGIVRAVVISGTEVYVGGQFTDAANIPEADYIAKWDGANWSALGGNGAGNGSLNNSVSALVIRGTELYVGGWFTNANNNGVAVPAADYIAKWNGASWSALGSNGANNGSLSTGVYALALSGTTLYAGGGFTNVNNNGTPIPEADYLAQWNGAGWSALGSNGAGNGSFGVGTYIATLAVSGANLYVGGNFTNVNNGGTVLTAADRVAKWDGADWSALGSNGAGDGSIAGTVYALAVSGTDVYAGGQFTDVNNNGAVLTAGDWLVRWDGASWNALGSNGASDGALNNYAMALVISGTDVYVGGNFINVNNNGTPLPTADYLAKWDGVAWSAIGDNGAGNGAIPGKGGATVMALAVQNNSVLAGGLFYDVNNGGVIQSQADFIAQWGGGQWSALGAEPNGALVNGYAGSAVYAITISGTEVFVGGNFTDVSNHGVNLTEADYIAKWDGANWSALGSNGAGDGSLNGPVNAIVISGTEVFVGGQFSNVNNNGVALPTADYIAKWNALTGSWSALGSNGAGNGALPSGGFVNTIVMSGTALYVGGYFTNAAAVPEADYLAIWNGASWSALGSNGAGNGAFNAQVSAMAVNPAGGLYVGGYFTNTATVPEADYVAQWNGANWSALGSNGAGNGSLNYGVQAIAVSGANVYVGGAFTNVNNNGTVLNNADIVARWDGTGWNALGSNGMGDGVFCVGCGSSVRTLVVLGSEVYVGGSFNNITSNGASLTAADFVANWDGASWSALGSNGAGNGAIQTNYGVYTLVTNGADLLVGGQFSNLNNNGTVVKEADYLAAYGLTGGAPDTTPPAVVSVTRLDPTPTTAASVRFLVTFSEIVGGLDVSDFFVTANGIRGAHVLNMSGCVGATCTVTISTGVGNGTLRLDVMDNDTIKDAANNPLGGVGMDNGQFTGGEVYTTQFQLLYLPLILR